MAASTPSPDDRHDERHALLIVGLLDRDVATHERATAERLLASCPGCASLEADLRILTAATRELPTVPRPRDFRLTMADATRLAPGHAVPGEPRRAVTRLTGEMQLPNPEHDRHDPLLVASLLDRTAEPAERERAHARIAACSDCAALHQDLLLLRNAARDLPAPTRPRAFTLSPDDAARQRPAGWRRLVAAFGSTRDVFSRPLAIGLTTIGLAGLLVSSASSLLSTGGSTSLTAIGNSVGAGGGATSQSLEGSKLAPLATAAPSTAGAAAAALPAPTAPPSEAPERAPAAPSAESFDTFVGAPTASAGAAPVAPEPDASAQRDARLGANSIEGPTPPSDTRLNVIIVAGLLLIAGLALFGLRWVARRI
jgi:hypothetical protein